MWVGVSMRNLILLSSDFNHLKLAITTCICYCFRLETRTVNYIVTIDIVSLTPSLNVLLPLQVHHSGISCMG